MKIAFKDGFLSTIRFKLVILSLATISVFFSTSDVVAKEAIWSDGNFYVYEEENSCALYADYDDESMLRISYKGSTDSVYFGYYRTAFAKMPLDETLTIAFTTEDDPSKLFGYVARIVDNNGRRGIAGRAGVELLNHMQGAQKLLIYGPLMLPVANLNTIGLDDAVKRMRRCGENK